MTVNSIKNAIRANPALAASLAALLFACLALAFAQGCDMRRMVKVDAPKDLLAAVDVPEPAEGITLAEADAVWADWTAWVNERSTRFRRAVDDAEGRYATLESLVNLGLDAANTAAPALPGGAFVVGGLSLLTGLMLKRPGEDKRVFAEKKDSYNAGIEEGKRLVLEALRPPPEVTSAPAVVERHEA